MLRLHYPTLPRYRYAYLPIALLVSTPLYATSPPTQTSPTPATTNLADLSKVITLQDPPQPNQANHFPYAIQSTPPNDKKNIQNLIVNHQHNLWFEYPNDFYDQPITCDDQQPFTIHQDRRHTIPIHLRTNLSMTIVCGYVRTNIVTHTFSAIVQIITRYLPRYFSHRTYPINVSMDLFYIQANHQRLPSNPKNFFMALTTTHIQALWSNPSHQQETIYTPYLPAASDYIVYNTIFKMYEARSRQGSKRYLPSPDLVDIYQAQDSHRILILDSVLLKIQSPSTRFLQDCTIKETRTSCIDTTILTIILVLR